MHSSPPLSQEGNVVQLEMLVRWALDEDDKEMVLSKYLLGGVSTLGELQNHWQGS